MIEVRDEIPDRPKLDPLGQAQFALWEGDRRIATFGLMGHSIFAPLLWLWLELEAAPSFAARRAARQIVPALADTFSVDTFLAEVDDEVGARFLRYLGFRLRDDNETYPVYEWSKTC